MPTRLGIVTDVHADVHALHDALTQTSRLGCDVVVCAGDIVDYGLFPEETIALLMQHNIPCVRGNHDRWAVSRADGELPTDVSGWDLSTSALAFLAGLPTHWRAELEGVAVAVHHASPDSDMRGIDPKACVRSDVERWLASARSAVLLVGHTHQAFRLHSTDGALIANPGALLRAPSDISADLTITGGTFGVLELPSRLFTVHRASDGVELGIPTFTV